MLGYLVSYGCPKSTRDYFEAERRYREAKTPKEKIARCMGASQGF